MWLWGNGLDLGRQQQRVLPFVAPVLPRFSTATTDKGALGGAVGGAGGIGGGNGSGAVCVLL